jgi:hypothetical protein
VEITFDLAKDERNIRERGLSFERAVDFDFETAIRVEDTRRDYGETRFVAVGYLGNRLHVLCFTETRPASGSSASGGQCERGAAIWPSESH